MQKGVRLSALHGVWCRVLELPRDNSSEPEYLSRAVHTQLAIIVTMGIIDLEVEILSELQKRIFSTKGPGKRNMLPIWTTLWLLIFTYRDTIDYWPPRDHKLQELTRQMYDMLVSIYSALFRPSSPLRLGWRGGETGLFKDFLDMFGGDDILMQRMGTLKTEFALYRKLRLPKIDSKLP